MKIIKWDAAEGIFELDRKEKFRPSFIFDFKLLPLDIEPRRVIFQAATKKETHQWSITWRNFKREQMIGDVVLIPKEKTVFKHFLNQGA